MRCDDEVEPGQGSKSKSETPTSSTEHDGPSCQPTVDCPDPEGDENRMASPGPVSPNTAKMLGNDYQGPHNWRKRLKHIHSPVLEDITLLGENMSNHKPSETAKVIRRKSSREDRWDDNKTRERMRAKRDAAKKGPLERKNSLMLPLNTTHRRAQSPNLIGESSSLRPGALRKRVDKVMKARLYLLQQLGPNSFLIGGDSPDHKYKVIIGPQRCNCGRGAHCVHILFVMLRVFQVRENDQCLWSKTLMNYEVEALFQNFHARRTSLIEDLMKKKSKPAPKQSEEEPSHDPDDNSGTITENVDKEEEEETCSICLLEMVEGESLVQCENGCQNKLHHHCIDIWFEECRRQAEALNCPLCRAKWKKQESNCDGLAPLNGELPAPPNTRASSPQLHDQELPMPHAEPIPPENMNTAKKWIPVIGEDITRCLFSKNWVVREIGLQQLSRIAVGALLLGVGEGRSGVVLSPTRQATTHTMLECCCDVLAFVCADPVYKVFVAALRTLRTVLSYTPCRDEHQQARLQILMTPVIQTILWKCADSNRRTSQLSISALQELAKGQNGELALGKEIVNPGQKGLGDLDFLLECIPKPETECETQWQGILGRLYVLDKLLEEYTSDLTIENCDSHDHHEATILDEAKNYDKVFGILTYCVSVMGHQHAKVSKMARRVFFLLARLQAGSRAVMKDVSELLEETTGHIQSHIRRKLWRVVDDYSASHRGKLDDPEPGVTPFDADGPAPPCSTPIVSESSTPRSQSPLTIDGTIGPNNPNIILHQLMLGQFGGQVAPPNSPNQKFRKRASNSVSSNGLVCDIDSTFSEEHASRIADNDLVSKLHSPLCRLSPQGSSQAVSPRYHQRRSHVEVADVCVGTSPRLPTRGIRRSLVSSVVDQEAEDDGNVEDDEDDGEDVDGKDVPDQALANEEILGFGGQIIVDRPLPLAFSEEPAYSAVDDSDAHTDDTQRIHKRKTRTPKLKRKHERSRSDPKPALEKAREDGEVEATAEIDTNDEDADFMKQTASRSQSRTETETQTQESKEDAETQTDDDELSSTNATINTTHAAFFSADLSDITLSNSGDDKVNFKDEVARASPSHSRSRNEPCPCKEEVEQEEAKALVEALEKSTISQDELPRVPGLSRTDSSQTLTIHIQDLENGSGTSEYKEDIHWRRGCMLGTGAFSTCYQARDVKTGTLMAVKQISYCRNSLSEQEKVIEAVREEILMMAKLNHPNIVRILGATQQGCHFFMFVEWMPGGSVAYLLDRYGLFTEQVQTSYTFQILHGLAYLHENHILHRDLKGANLLIDSTGQRVRIGDFGASARLATRQTGAGEFQGQLLGTIAFMAPEVLRGESYGRGCDVWSVGCVMIEMATGKPPWGAHDISNHLALIFKIASSSSHPPIPENISPAIKDLILRCLEPSREDRPPARELLKHPLFTMPNK